MASQDKRDSIGPNTCPRCTEKGTLSCSRCNDIKYCSAECQQADWPMHKVLCGSLKALRPCPSADHTLVLLFPPSSGAKPYFDWAWTPACAPGHIEPPMVDNVTRADTLGIMENTWTGEPLDYLLTVMFDQGALGKALVADHSVCAASKGNLRVFSQGFVAVYCGTQREPHPEKPIVGESHDMNMRVYSDLIGNLARCMLIEAVRVRVQRPRVTCVKVASREATLQGVPPYQAVQVPLSHPVFQGESCVSIASSLADLPLMTYKYPGSKSAAAAADASNAIVSAIHICCDITSSTYGQPGDGFGSGDGDVGTQLVARLDRTPLDCDTVEVFGEWCAGVLALALRHVRKIMEDERETPQKFVSMAYDLLNSTVERTWARHFSDWKARKAAGAAAAAGGSAGSAVGNAVATAGAAGNSDNDG